MLIDRRTVILGAATLAAATTADSATPDATELQMNSPTERVLGIGGLFFRSRDPKKQNRARLPLQSFEAMVF